MGLMKRLDAAIKSGGQPRKGQCVMCGRDWMSCPHSRAEVEALIEARKMVKLMGKVR